MENHVVRLTDDTLSTFLGNNDSAKAILFTSKGPTSALYKSLAIDFQGRLTLAQVRDTQKAVVSEFNVETFPALVVLPGGSAPGVVYEGEMNKDAMFQFLSEYAPAAQPEPPKPVKQDTTGVRRLSH
jgi:protein disulfide-isomerase A6